MIALTLNFLLYVHVTGMHNVLHKERLSVYSLTCDAFLSECFFGKRKNKVPFRSAHDRKNLQPHINYNIIHVRYVGKTTGIKLGASSVFLINVSYVMLRHIHVYG